MLASTTFFDSDFIEAQGKVIRRYQNEARRLKRVFEENPKAKIDTISIDPTPEDFDEDTGPIFLLYKISLKGLKEGTANTFVISAPIPPVWLKNKIDEMGE
jgi:hypothetical protein